MFRRRTITAFLCRFALLYTLLLVPWPGVREVYGVFFRGLGQMVFGWETGPLNVTFNPYQSGTSKSLDTRVVIVNPDLMHADGSGPVRNLDLSAADFWKSAALLMALVLATPVPWRRRCRALLWGMLCEHGFFVLFLGFQIWDEAAFLSPKTLTPFHTALAAGMKEGLIDQAGLAVPILIWILTTFRSEDRTGDIGRLAFGNAATG